MGTILLSAKLIPYELEELNLKIFMNTGQEARSQNDTRLYEWCNACCEYAYAHMKLLTDTNG